MQALIGVDFDKSAGLAATNFFSDILTSIIGTTRIPVKVIFFFAFLD